MRLTSRFLLKYTLEREQLPCCFLESYAWIFYNEGEQKSNDITRELLVMLGHSRDYHRVIEYASRALSLEPGIQDAYYWISIASEATGNSMMKDRYDQMARDELPEEEYQKVQHLLEIRTHKED